MKEDAKKKAEENSSAFFALANKAMADDKKAKAEKAATNIENALEKKEAARKNATMRKRPRHKIDSYALRLLKRFSRHKWTKKLKINYLTNAKIIVFRLKMSHQVLNKQ